MATDANCLTATGSNDAPDAATKPQKEPICLGMFAAKMSAEETISRTAQYAKDPKAYLEKQLGQATLDKRRSLLSIPEIVGKDMYGTGAHKQGFEQHFARLLGKAHGLFFITGVQAQLAALKIYCERAGRNLVAWHITSHLESAEEKSFETLYSLQRVLLGSERDALPTVADIKTALKLPPSERPVAIVLEIPNRVLGCKTYSFAELEEISESCRDAEVALHCDGARLWEIEPYYQATAGKTFDDIGKLFDSVYVSFYKGLRGVTGSVLVHNDKAFIDQAKVWQRRAGGNAFTLMYEIIDCERGYNLNIGKFDLRWKKMQDVVSGVLKNTAKFKVDGGRPVVSFIPEAPTCCQIHTLFQGYTGDELDAARDKVQERLNVRVYERLWPKQTLDEKNESERAASDSANASKANGAGSEKNTTREAEWMISDATENIETEVFVSGYVALCEELVSAKQAATAS